MTKLERKALLGDYQAKVELSFNNRVLPCPVCGGFSYVKIFEKFFRKYKRYQVKCSKCGLQGKKYNNIGSALLNWNERPEPPIGRCWKCENGGIVFSDNTLSCSVHKCDMGKNDYCSYFEPKEEQQCE